MALIRVCDICDRRVYDNEKFYKLDYGTSKEHADDHFVTHIEICKKCFGVITQLIKEKRDAEKKEAENDN